MQCICCYDNRMSTKKNPISEFFLSGEFIKSLVDKESYNLSQCCCEREQKVLYLALSFRAVSMLMQALSTNICRYLVVRALLQSSGPGAGTNHLGQGHLNHGCPYDSLFVIPYTNLKTGFHTAQALFSTTVDSTWSLPSPQSLLSVVWWGSSLSVY